MSRRHSMGWGPGRPPPRPPAPAPPRPPSPPDPPDNGPGGAVAALQSQADKLISVASHSSNLPGGVASQSSLEDLLSRLHSQESIRDTRSSHLNLGSNLLQKLSTSSNVSLSRLLITLHPGDDGYSLSLMTGTGVEMELARYGYDDLDILESIDNQEIPVTVMDLVTDVLEAETSELYHNNCVVCEVRDNRRSSLHQPHLILLRPTTQSIICDSFSMTSTNPGISSQSKWSPEDRNNLESQLLLSSGNPLCLDPSPVVSLIAGKLEHSRKKFSSLPMRHHAVKKYSQAGQNRKRKFEMLAAPPELALHDFIKQKQSQTTHAQTGTGATPGKRKLTGAEVIKQHQDSVQARVRTAEMTNWTQGCLNLASPDTRLSVPAQVDVGKFVRPLARKAETTDMTPQLDSEYILETAERGQQRIYHTRLTILKRPANDEYIGELYVERDYREQDKKGSTCRFELGTLTNATRYINQFTEIFTEEGRKNVKITHRVPNHPPRVSFTPGLRAIIGPQQQQQLQQQLAQQQQQQGQGGAAGASSQAATALLHKKPQIVTAQPQLQVSNGGKVAGSVSGPIPVSGSITVSSAGLGQVALQLQQQGGGKLVPQIVQQRLAQQPGVQVVQQQGAPQQQQTVQVVQQINTSGQVVHQVLQTVPQGHVLQQQVNQQQPAVSGGQAGVVSGGQAGGQPAVAAAGQIIQTSIGQLNFVPTSIANKLPTAPIARPDLPTSSAAALQPQPQQQLQQQKPKAGETEAISAIVQSLMREGTQFEFEAKKRAAEEQRKSLPSPLPSPGVSLSQPQLPTVPVPAASLASVTAAGSAARVSISGLQQLNSANTSVSGLQVSATSGQHMIVVNTTVGPTSGHMSQLAAQLARPSHGTLPTYSQAISQQVAGGVVTTLQSGSTHALQTSPLRRPSEAASPHTQLMTSPGPQHSLASPSEGGSGSGALTALLADAAASDRPLPPGSGSVSSNSLLERLVSGGHAGAGSASANSNLSPAASQLPSVQTGGGGQSGMSNGAGDQEITLQSLLSHPAKVQPHQSPSPSKVSPLLQQLQQPVQSATSPRTYPPGLTSPRHPPASPRTGVTSPRPAQSPRQINPPQSPGTRAPTPGPISALQQQLMQPPAPRYPVTTQSILSSYLTVQPRNVNAATASAQSLLNTSQSQVVSVSLDQGGVANGGASATVATPTVQLVQQPVQQPVQLVSNTGQVQLVNQQQLQVVNHHVNNVQLVNNSTSASGQAVQSVQGVQNVQLVNQQGNLQQVQLVNQVGGGSVTGGQQIMVNNVPMLLSSSPHVQFSVNLADTQSNSIVTHATLANGVNVNTPLIVSGTSGAQPGTVTVTSMANLGKIVSNGPNGAPAPATVLLQGNAGNLILPSGVKQVSGVPAGGQVMVRQAQGHAQQSPVLVQLNSGQQIVRQVSLNPGNINCNIVNKTQAVSSTSLSASAVSSPHTSSSSNASESSQMLVHLNHQQESTPHFLLAGNSNQKSSSGLSGQMMTGTLNQATLSNKIRQQRKQSLK